MLYSKGALPTILGCINVRSAVLTWELGQVFELVDPSAKNQDFLLLPSKESNGLLCRVNQIKMKSLSLLVFGLSTSFSLATVPPPGPDGKYTLSAPGIRAQVRLLHFLIFIRVQC